MIEGGKITAYTTTIAPAERARVGAAVAARQQPQAPPGMPSTGGDALAPLITGLFAAALLCLGAGALTRRTRSRS